MFLKRGDRTSFVASLHFAVALGAVLCHIWKESGLIAKFAQGSEALMNLAKRLELCVRNVL